MKGPPFPNLNKKNWFKIVLKVIFPNTHRVIFFRWPVAYFGSCTATAHQLYSTYWKCVDVLDEHGFTVDYVMADGASTNRAFTNMLFSSNMREQQFKFCDIFNMNHSMCAIQDIMHVL
jgi:hypothetical protein